jgi:hypothetical protein
VSSISVSKLFIRCDFLRWRYTKAPTKKANPIPYWPIPAEKERYKMTSPPVRMNSKEIMALRYFMWVDVVKWLPNNPKSEENGGLI